MTVLDSVIVAAQKASMVWLKLTHVFGITAPSLRPKSSTRLIARIRLLARLASAVALLAYELAFGDSLRALTRVSKNESVACLIGSLLACQVTRCSTSTNPVSIGVSKEGENITYGASCQAACAVGFESANHADSPGKITLCVCGEKCVDVATSDSSMLAPDCLNWTSGDPCKAMCAADHTSGASTLTGTLDDGNGSVAISEVFQNI